MSLLDGFGGKPKEKTHRAKGVPKREVGVFGPALAPTSLA